MTELRAIAKSMYRLFRVVNVNERQLTQTFFYCFKSILTILIPTKSGFGGGDGVKRT